MFCVEATNEFGEVLIVEVGDEEARSAKCVVSNVVEKRFGRCESRVLRVVCVGFLSYGGDVYPSCFGM